MLHIELSHGDSVIYPLHQNSQARHRTHNWHRIAIYSTIVDTEVKHIFDARLENRYHSTCPTGRPIFSYQSSIDKQGDALADKLSLQLRALTLLAAA